MLLLLLLAVAPTLSPVISQVARFQQEAAGLARARAEKESELRKLRQDNDKYVEDLEERERKFQVSLCYHGNCCKFPLQYLDVFCHGSSYVLLR